MNKNLKIGLLVAAAGVPLVLLLASYASVASSQVQPPPGPEDENVIFIDFSIMPETEPIVVERGKTVIVPLKIEAPHNAEKTLKINVAQEHGNIDPTVLKAVLSQNTVQLKADDVANGRASDLGQTAERSAGTLTLTAPANLDAGTYTITIEAEQEADGKLADALVSAKMVRIEVK